MYISMPLPANAITSQLHWRAHRFREHDFAIQVFDPNSQVTIFFDFHNPVIEIFLHLFVPQFDRLLERLGSVRAEYPFHAPELFIVFL